jgi:hypothetical protein
MALGVEKFAEIANGEHDPSKVAVALGTVAFTTAAHYLVHSSFEQRNETKREELATRNHLVRRGMLAALRRALKETPKPNDDKALFEDLLSGWDHALEQAEHGDDALERFFPAEVFTEAYWDASNPFCPNAEQAVEALAALLREWLTADLDLVNRWSEQDALDFAAKVLSRFQNAFADDIVHESSVLYQAFTVKGINQIRAVTLELAAT